MSKPHVRAAIYTRISRDKKGEAVGVTRQRKECEALANRLGCSTTRLFEDNDKSAYSGRKRPGYEALLNAIEAGEVDVVIAWAPDRLHRRGRELDAYIAVVHPRDIDTHTVQAGAWNLATPAGRLNARVVAAFSTYESEHRGARVSAAAAQRAAEGRWNGGRRCYGYQADGRTIKKREAAALLHAAESIAAGASLTQTASDMNRAKQFRANGKPWTGVLLRDALLAPRVAGLASRKGEILGEAEWPAIIPADLWYAVRAILLDPNRRTNRGTAPRWLGSGIYLCGVCEEPVRVRRHGKYSCHVSRDAAELDRYVGKLIVARLSDPKVLKRLAPKKRGGDAGKLQREAEDVRRRREEAAVLFADGSIKADQLAAITAKCSQRLDELNAALAATVGRSPVSALLDAADVGAAWGGLDLGVKREIVKLLVEVRIQPAVPGRRDPIDAYVEVRWL